MYTEKVPKGSILGDGPKNNSFPTLAIPARSLQIPPSFFHRIKQFKRIILQNE
jgi:hypothetical protein